MSEQDLNRYAADLGRRARAAGLALGAIDAETRSRAIRRLGALIDEQADALLKANAIDVQAAEQAGLATPVLKRLMLDAAKVRKMADAVRDIADQPDPIGQIIDQHTRADGLLIAKRRVPIGVVLFCFESRPNVTSDASALCLRSGNAVILRGGKEAMHCNQIVARLARQSLEETGLPVDAIQLVETTDRALLPMLLKLDRDIDLVIPRGGESLIRAVVQDSTIPVLKHFTGNCHVYIDAATPDSKQVVDLVVNAKTSYPGGAVCNAVEHILIHQAVANDLVKQIGVALRAKDVEVRTDTAIKSLIPDAKDATDADWDEEYLAFIVGIRQVGSMDEAIDHINRHGSHHTDAILSTDPDAIETFIKRVDSASIMVNASTRIADGGEYGLGAEIGISTDKLHARGPMGAADLTTYKWVVTGQGHLR